MLTNYLKISWRKIQSQRFYAVINILGLAIGIACCLLITLFVLDEINYDSYNEKADRIYRVAGAVNLNGDLQEFGVVSSLLANVLESEIPEVENTVRFRQFGSWLVKKEGTVQNFREQRVTYVDGALFDIFTLPFLYGDQGNALKKPNTLVLTQSAAEKYFGTTNPIGETLILDDDESYTVDGVCMDIPSNSHFHYDFFLSMEGLAEARNDIWLNNNFYTYILTKPSADALEMEAKVNTVFKKYAGAQMKEFTGTTFEEFEASGNFFRYNLQPLRSIHLDSNLAVEHEPNGNIAYVFIFSAIAFFILLIACINFMNMSTARSSNRAKEVGMRKILGSLRRDLIGQFLMESILMSLMAFTLAILASQLVMPAFNKLIDKTLNIPFTEPLFIASILSSIILVGLLAGSYPAFFLSAFEPLKVIKGDLQKGSKSGWLRQILVTSQFSISIILMIGTGVIYNQLNFIQNKRLGFDKEQIFMLNANNYPSSFEALKNQLNDLPEVKNSTVTCNIPAIASCRSSNSFWQEGKNIGSDAHSLQAWTVDYEYVQTFGMEMETGRFFDRKFTTDTSAIILNEAAVKIFQLENPIGARIQTYVNPQTQTVKTYTVVGVIKDFNYNSLKDKIEPLSMVLDDNFVTTISMRIDATTGVNDFVGKVKNIWQNGAPGQPFIYSFLDDNFNEIYENEQRLGTIFLIFAGLAIFIACLGLLALAAFTAERRRKEISIRKVLGASVPNIVSLLSKEFILLVGFALIISIPVAWYIMNQWLQNFAYRVELSWWIFALAGIIAIFIALLTVSFQSIKAALSNPIQALKDE